LSLRSILFLVNGVALVIFIAAAVVSARRHKPAPPANLTAYYDDPTLEGPKLERFLGAAVLFSAVLAASLPVYWLLEPNRQSGMDSDFLADSVERGKERFARVAVPGSEILPLECARCHGDKAEGGAATYVLTPDDPGEVTKTVQWTAPSLDDVMLRFTPDEVAQIITYGRPGTPMPAWGLAGGGPLPKQPVDDLVNYLKSIQISSPDAKKRSIERLNTLKAEKPGISDGEGLFNINCARCHTKGYSYGEPKVPGGGGAFGPNLTNGVELRQFPDAADGVKKHTEFVTTGSDFQKQYGLQGIGSGRMPGFGGILTADQIAKIVAYERGL
jgi:mono/diheme cytochrome c family protein